MCGVGGVISDNDLIRKSFIQWVNEKQCYRGPDNSNSFFEEKIGICHQRLSIIDLSEKSNQPYISSDIVLSFNGEIYNYKHLLKNKKFSKLKNIYSDTIFFAEAWNKFDDTVLRLFEGMYAASIFNKKEKTITLLADEFGIKTLYYFQSKGNLLWSSEFEVLFSFIKNKFEYGISQDSLNHTYSFLAPLCGQTIVKEIKRVLPGEILMFDNKAKLIKRKRNKLFLNEDNFNSLINAKNISKEIEKTFISDVEIATLISGGIDSSYICNKVNQNKINQHLFHYKHPDSLDGFVSDTTYANYLSKSLGLKLNYVERKEKISINDLKDIFKSIKVSGDISAAIPLREICKSITKTKKCKVLLSGLGADEIFKGYKVHKILATKQIFLSKLKMFFRITYKILKPSIEKLFPKPLARRILMSLNILSSRNDFGNIDTFIWGSSNKLINNEFIKHYENLGLINSSSFSRISSLYFLHFLAAVHLPISDSVSMASSIELRPVFLIKKFVNKITFKPSINDIFYSKKLLKEELKFKFGKKFVNRPKVGFGIEPNLLSKEIIDWLYLILKNSNLCDISLLSRIEKDLKDKKNALYSRKLYGLISLAHSISMISPEILE